MHIQVDIGFEQLLEIVKKLPVEQLSRLKQEIEKSEEHEDQNFDREAFLLNAPVFTDEQIDEITEARKAINKWRIN